MASYRLFFKASAEKELRGLPRPDMERVLRRIGALGEEPRPRGCEKLVGQERYRVRQGDWRVVYEVDDAARVVRIFRLGHRRDVYR